MLPEALGNAFPVGEPGTENWVVGLQQVALGRPIDDVLADLAGDAGAQERLLIAVLRMGQRSGGRLAASLESVAERLAEEVDLVDRRRVLTTQARVSGQVLAALPVVFATVLAVLRGGTAYTGTIGQSSLIGGLVLNVAGLGWMRRQLRVLQ
jgi:Flp pilus assembly protein TadB